MIEVLIYYGRGDRRRTHCSAREKCEQMKDETAASNIEKLEDNVIGANEARNKWKFMRGRGIVPLDDNKMYSLSGELMKAEDELAHAKFSQRV
mmetsp:Transcript_30400/g.64352  ORF Transcript_30400/g.64352 Transcript_30400/m.64352 type:complete len:93 (+) Transcript_30400:284-562(+)